MKIIGIKPIGLEDRMMRTLMLAALVLMTLTFLLAGCELEADKEVTEMPSRGYGDTFKIHVDDVGLFRDIDESGKTTDRRGLWYDRDHDFFDRPDGVDIRDNVKDMFYQIDKPTAGIIGLSFGEDGYADGGKPIAMAKLVPGVQDYDIPLDSIMEWVREDAALGYIPSKYNDDSNILVYYNRVTGVEYEAALTGEKRERGYKFQSLGTIRVRPGGTKSATSEDPEELYSTDEDEGDYAPAFVGDVNPRCAEWGEVCKKEDECDMFEDGWSVTDCKQRMFNYYDGNVGSQYLGCLKGCLGKGCDEFQTCKNLCLKNRLTDAYGCGGSYGPDVMDVFYVIETDGEYAFAEEGVEISGDSRLSVYVEYADVECNMDGGKFIVTINGNETKFNLPSGIGCNSVQDGLFIGFTFENPFPEGRVDFSLSMSDGELNGEPCGQIGEQTYNGYFEVSEPGRDVIDTRFDEIRRMFDMFEVYAPNLTKYNTGTGFIDVHSIASKFVYELMEFDVGIIQGYIWSFKGTHSLGDLDLTRLNNLIFTTTHDTRGTKYDESDDVQASAFYIDQPMSPGLFTFYGDAGWNLYPKGPYGRENDNQPFVKGDFETTRVSLPMNPYFSVDLKYTGCAASCETYFETVYDVLRKKFKAFDTREEAMESCQNDFRDEYWSCQVDCIKKAEVGLNGCITLDNCQKNCPSSPSGGNQSWCDMADDIAIKMQLNIDSAFLSNCVYKKVLYGPDSEQAGGCSWTQDEIEDWEPLKIGVLGISTAGSLDPLPGAVEDVEPGKSNYLIHLPFGPKMPLTFLPIGSEMSAGQGQMYLAAFDKDGKIFATGFYPPDDNNDVGWLWLLIYGYNWSGGSLEGWSLGTVAGNSITDTVDIREPVLEMEFGDIRALSNGPEEDFLDPNASEL